MSCAEDIAAHAAPQWEVARRFQRDVPDARIVMSEGYEPRYDFQLVFPAGMVKTYEVKCDWDSAVYGNLFFEWQALEDTRADCWLHYTPRQGIYTYCPRRMFAWLRQERFTPCWKTSVGDGNADGWAVRIPAVETWGFVGWRPGFRIPTRFHPAKKSSTFPLTDSGPGSRRGP